MEFLILGPLVVLDDGVPLELGGAKPRGALAILLLRRNEAVSRDRLIDGLWGETPPASAAHTLETYMSRLRKALQSNGSTDRLRTRPPGYLLRVDDGELDLARFEGLLDQASTGRLSGDPWTTREVLCEALSLFRGAPLEDLGHAPFALAEVQRLEELRLGAQEQRLDADLAVGQAAEVVGELESLVARFPFREHFWEQLMLALYRSGRQRDALIAFDRARGKLVVELGVDPGQSLQRLQRRILEQDPSLERADASAMGSSPVTGTAPSPARSELLHEAAPGPPVAPAETPTNQTQRRRLLMLATGCAVILALITGTLTWLGLRDHPSAAAPSGAVPGPSFRILSFDALTGAPGSTYLVAGRVGAMASDIGHLWITDASAGVVRELDTADGKIARTIAVGVGPLGVAAGDAGDGKDSVWVANAAAGTVTRIDPSNGRIVATIHVGDGIQELAVGRGGVWAAGPTIDSVRLIDPSSNDVTATVKLTVPSSVQAALRSDYRPYHVEGIIGLAATSDSLWVTIAGTATATWVELIDPATGRVQWAAGADESQEGYPGFAPIVQEGAVLWAARPTLAEISRVDAVTGREAAKPIQVGSTCSLLSLAIPRVWVGCTLVRRVIVIDSNQGNLLTTINLDGIPGSIVSDGEHVWVAAE